jgi:hypothetical protein
VERAGEVRSGPLDQVLDGLPQPGIGARELTADFEARIREVVDDHHLAGLGCIPARNVVAVLTDREWNEVAIRITIREAEKPLAEKLAADNPPGLEVRETKLHETDELRGILEADRQILGSKEISHVSSRTNR